MQTKALLLAIKARLIEALAAYVRPSDVFIAPDPGFLPKGYRFPCVGIKDGPVTFAERPSETEERVHQVGLMVWASINKAEATLVGDEAAGFRGILEITGDVIAALRGRQVQAPGFDWGRPVSVNETELAADDAFSASVQAVLYEFTWEGDV